MNAKYEPLPTARFTTSTVDGSYQIAIPVQKNWFVLAFLGFWLTAWTVGGVAAFVQVLTSTHTNERMTSLFFLGPWLLGFLAVGYVTLWLLTGEEILSVKGSDLEVSYRSFGYGRARLYRGTDIRNLSAQEPDILSRFYRFPLPMPFGSWLNLGSIQFDYGPRTIHVAAGLDKPEGQLIIEQLKRFLPTIAIAKD